MGRRALVLEDNRSALSLLTETLKAGGWRVGSAGTLAEALMSPQAEIIVADLNVPDSDGLDTVGRLATRSEPIVVLTDAGNEQHAADAIEAGAAHYLVKGDYSPGELLRACHHALERGRRQDAVARAHTELLGLFTANPDALVLVDSSDVVRLANTAATRTLGLDVGDTLRVREGIWETIRAGSNLLFNGTPVTWAGAPATLVSVREGASQRQAGPTLAMPERRLERAHAMKALGRICARLDREYSDALRALSAGLGRLAAEDPGLVQTVDPMLDTLAHLEEINRTVRAFGGQRQTEPGASALDPLLRSLDADLQRALGADLVLVFDLNAPGCRVGLSDGDLRFCLVHLLENAAAASLRGEVTVRTSLRGEVVWIEVEDEGVGMEPDILSWALEPFYTTDVSRAGLGLSAVGGMVRAVGGVVDLQSHVEGGTTARLLLPLIPEPDPGSDGPGDPTGTSGS